MVLIKGYETNTLRWSEKGKVAKKGNAPTSGKKEAKYGNGFFASSGLGQVLGTRQKPIDRNPSGSSSDMDISSGSDDENVVKRFVVNSSQKERVVASRPKKASTVNEDESSDSATSTEISYGRSEAVENGFGKNKVFHYDDTPSAPPMYEFSGPNISQTSVDWISSSECHVASEDQNTDYAFPSVTSEERSSTVRNGFGSKVNGSETSLSARLSGFQPRLISEQGTFCAVVSYDACVRLCLHEWALRGSSEVHCFLENECALLRHTFGLRHVLLQSEDELMEKRSTELVSQVAGQKSRKTFGKLKLQVRKVKIGSQPLPSCLGLSSSIDFPVIDNESLKRRYIKFKSTLSSTFKSVQMVRVSPRLPVNASISRRSSAYFQASTEYLKQVSKVLKEGAEKYCKSSSSDEQTVQETYCCLLKLKSSSNEDTIRMRPGSGEDHVFFPEGLSDSLVVDIQDSKGSNYGRVLAQVAAIADNPDDKLKWWPIYSDPGHETVGRVQLYINYTNTQGESSHPKCGSVAETTAYDFLLEVAFKEQNFSQRNLLLKAPWKWLVIEFASYYGVSDAYTKLRYLSYVMDVATPTEYCVNLVYDLLSHVLVKGNRNALSHQEKRILAETEDQVKDILGLVFENYKSLDESSQSGMLEVFMPASGSVAPALPPAVRIYSLLHDILTPEAQSKLCKYFQTATKKRLRRHLAETEEFASTKNEGSSVDLPISYEKMKSLIINVRNEIFTDMKIHNQNVLPSFIDLPNISSSLYTAELSTRLREFLIACPPAGPSRPVSQLVIAAADFQRDLFLWNINPVNGGVDAKGLFNSHIIRWIQDKRHALLDLCKQEKVKSCNVSGGGAQEALTSPFIEEMFDCLVETINEYRVVLCRWPEYICLLEKSIADVEKAIFDALEKQFADVLLPLKDTLTNKIFGHKYVQRLSKGAANNTYSVPDELGVLLNSMRRLLDTLCPKIETQLKSWSSSCIGDEGSFVIGEHLNDVKVMLRAKFRSYKQAIVEKLADNTKVQNVTKLKSIMRESKDDEASLRSRMDPLKDLLTKMMRQLDTVVETPVFIQICRELWERMGQDVLNILEDGKEKSSWYKGLRLAVSILDEVFASEMQKLRGKSLNEKELEPPGSIRELHSMLYKDASY